MSQSASAARSRRASNRTPSRVAFVLLRTTGAVVLIPYLAGYFLLWSLKLSPISATPLTILQYAHYYGDYPQVRRRLILSLAFATACVAAAAAVAFWPRARPLHGDARFATRREIARAGLLGDRGILLGEYGGRYLMLDGQQGVALAAPPRSGKGVGIVIPNLLNFSGSVVCVDVKKENYTLTAGFRKAMGQDVHLFDPLATDGRTARTNLFSYVPNDPAGRIDGIQKIADRLYPETPGIDPFWISSARSLFTGISLYLFETPSLPKTIGEVRRQGMASDDEGFAKHWRRIVEGRQSGRNPLSAECVRALFDVIDLAPVTASSIRKTFTSRLDLWANPRLDAATSGDDFDLRDLRKKPMSIYVGINPDDLSRLRPLLSLFFQQAIGLQTAELPEHNPALKHQVFMLLDELTALGPIDVLARTAGFLGSYDIRLGIIIQSYSQLREVYGPHSATTLLKTLAARIVFAPNNIEDAKEISEELGYTTLKTRSISRPRFGLGGGGRGGSRSGSITQSEQRRALLLPQEVRDIGVDREILFYENLRPVFAHKIRYYADPIFRKRLLPPPIQAAVPEVTVLSTAAGTASYASAAGSESVARHPKDTPMSATVETREPDVSDIERLESLTLDDFPGNFDHITLPEDREPTAQELQAAVDQFIEVVRSQ